MFRRCATIRGCANGFGAATLFPAQKAAKFNFIFMKARTKRPFPARSQHQDMLDSNEKLHGGHFGVSIRAREYAGRVRGTASALAGLVESMADSDVADPILTRPLAFNGIPGTGLRIVIQYGTPLRWSRELPDGSLELPACRHFVTGHQTGVIVAQPTGAVGTLGVNLRPEAAARLLGDRLQCFLDTAVGLDDIFGAGKVSLLEEMLAEAATSAERFACVEGFLAANLRAPHTDPIECRAAAMLRRRPQLRVRHLAPQLGVSERQLSRRFQAMFGVSPKQFARLARIETVWSSRAKGATWAEVAHATGFTDQAHMINDFTEIVGMSPAQLARSAIPLSPGRALCNVTVAEDCAPDPFLRVR